MAPSALFFISPKNAFRCGLLVFVSLVVLVKSEDASENLVSSCEVDNLLKQFVPPGEYYSIQAQALRQELYKKVSQKLDEMYGEGGKRSLASLARSGNFPDLSKRNVAALARAGLLKTPQEGESSDEEAVDEESEDFKRSLSTLAKSGQLPFQRSDPDESKRGIESLARNGELPRKRELEDLLNELYDKRNIGSLAKNYNFPAYGKRFLGALARNGDLPNDYDKRNLGSVMRSGKRNVGSFARSNGLPFGKRYPFDFKRNLASVMRTGKRNAAALLRQDSYMNTEGKHYAEEEQHPVTQTDSDVQDNEDKRNLAALKAHQKFKRFAVQDKKGQQQNLRMKRDAAGYYDPNEELPVPVYQNQNTMDYEDLIHALTGQYAPEEKRFLGSVARSGWFRSPGNSQYRTPEKRHIGSLARLGWLPSFRSVRSRFSRSGRSVTYDDDVDVDVPGLREDSTNGEAENDAFPENKVLNEKRYLLQPAVDNLLPKKVIPTTPQVQTLNL